MSQATRWPLAVIRPEPGNRETVARAQAMGLAVIAMPLFAVRPLDWDAPDPADYDALLIGSANAFRHGGEALARYRHLPVLAVGKATAAAARAAGFSVEAQGRGGLDTLLPHARSAGYRRLLRLGGRDRVTLDTQGLSVEARSLYASEAVPMQADDAAALAKGAVVAVHSARAMTQLAEQCATHAVPRDALSLVVIGPRVAAEAGSGWRALHTADTPDDDALLAAARNMCEKPR